MALWGNIDSKGSGGTVSLNYSTLVVTGSGTTFGQVGAAATGDIIRFGNVAGEYFGDAVIVDIVSNTQLSIASTSNLSGTSIASTSFNISQLPKFTTHNSHFKVGVSTIYDAYVYGVDAAEAEVSTTTSYDVTHAGWVGVTTYLDWEGNLRVKTETLVAMSSIVGDADDDLVFPDAIITILTQPSSVSIGTTANAVFEVEASTVPSSAVLEYEWQEDDGLGGGFVDVEDGGDYDGANTPILFVANDDDKNGYEYRVVISTGDVSVTSGIASITYV
jgi:hypothetical protein